MSFILDALRKAEQERHLGQAPTLEAIAVQAPPPQRRAWPWLLAAALVLNLLTVVWLAVPWRPAERLADAAQEPIAPPATTPAPVVDSPVSATPESIAESALPPVAAVPLQQPLAPLNLDIHVFSDIPERRFVIINGKRYQEGDSLEEGPLLEAITIDGATLSHQGQRFTLQVQR